MTHFEQWFKWKYKHSYYKYISKAAKALGDTEELEKEIEDEYRKWREEAMKQDLIGWLGGNYDDFGFYDNKKDAERGHMPSERLFEIIDDKFDGKKVKITIELVEE